MEMLEWKTVIQIYTKKMDPFAFLLYVLNKTVIVHKKQSSASTSCLPIFPISAFHF